MKFSFFAFPRYFPVFFIVFSGTIFFVALESFRNYRAEAELLVLSRSVSIPSETAAKTFAALPETLTFYDRLLAEHDGIEDPWSELSRIERKDRWGRVVETEVLPETNLLRFSVSAETSEQATALLGASLETFYGFAGRLYDRDTEANIRLIEHSGTRATLHSVGALVVMSLLFGGALAFLVSTLFRSSFRPFSMLSFPLKNVPGFSGESPSSEMIRPIGNFSRQTDEARFVDVEKLTNKSAAKDSKISESNSEVAAPVLPESSPVRSVLETSAFESVASWRGDSATETASVNTSDDPGDIWERPRSILQPIRNEAGSNRLAAEENRVRVGHAIQSGVGKQSPTPGNLETIPAEDFKWENVLVPIAEETASISEASGMKTDTFSPSPVGGEPITPPEHREPTTEELKARLNELLRGEM